MRKLCRARQRLWFSAMVISLCIMTSSIALPHMMDPEHGEISRNDAGCQIIQCEQQHVSFASTFLGGENNDGMFYTGMDVAQAANGDIVVVGTTESSDFSVTDDAYGTGYMGHGDLFVVRLNEDLTQAVFATVIGGTGRETVTETYS